MIRIRIKEIRTTFTTWFFFNNGVTKETFEVHGTIARFYINEVRGNSTTPDFPISDSRLWVANPKDGISYFSEYTLRWEQLTNNVIKKFYKPFDPSQSQDQKRLHEFDPLTKNTLIAYTEEYSIASSTMNFANWKEEPGLGKYNGSIGIRSIGMPSQILLHETAGFADLSIPNIREVQTKTGSFFPIPHFCVNNLDDKGNGNIIQFVDIATNVPHGELTNARAIGIEFVNPVIEQFNLDASGKRSPVLNLDKSQKGIFIKTKLSGLPQLFIPMEFSAEAGSTYHELTLRKDRLINFAALTAGIGPDKKQLLFEDGDNVHLRFAKSDKFEHLTTLVGSLLSNALVAHLDDLTSGKFWAPIVDSDGTHFYLFEHGVLNQKNVGTHFFFDVRAAAILTHLLIGSDHVDGGLQGLYLYLRFVRKVRVDSILQLIVTFLTSDKTALESKKITLTSQVLHTKSGFVIPPKPIKKEFSDILELDDALIKANASS